jgi:hypothetical protein
VKRLPNGISPDRAPMQIYDGTSRSYFGTLPPTPAAQGVDPSRQFDLNATQKTLRALDGDDE